MRNGLGKVALCLGAFCCGAALFPPERDYFPDWQTAPSLPEQRNVRLTAKSSVTVSRLVPEHPYILSEAATLKREVVSAGSILVRINERPFTACEMARPGGHESFACFVDGDGDGRFESTYRLMSHSFFLLAGWSNRAPAPITPVSYRPGAADTLTDYVELKLVFGRKHTKGRWSFTLRPESRQRPDAWVHAGKLVIGPGNVGQRVNIHGSDLVIKAVDDLGVTVDIVPPATPTQTQFTIQKK